MLREFRLQPEIVHTIPLNSLLNSFRSQPAWIIMLVKQALEGNIEGNLLHQMIHERLERYVIGEDGLSRLCTNTTICTRSVCGGGVQLG